MKYRGANEVDGSFLVRGEFAYFKGDGFTLDLQPDITIDEYKRIMSSDGADKVFFSEPARGIIIVFTTYSPSTDWWMNVLLHYEYGINDKVTVTEA